MKEPPCQFGLKALFVAMTDAAILLTPVHYVPIPLLIALGILFVLLMLLVAVFCWLIGGRQPPNA